VLELDTTTFVIPGEYVKNGDDRLVVLNQIAQEVIKRRLRAAGVSFEDRQDLLGHRSGRVTTHYSRAELCKLIAAANAICQPVVDGVES